MNLPYHPQPKARGRRGPVSRLVVVLVLGGVLGVGGMCAALVVFAALMGDPGRVPGRRPALTVPSAGVAAGRSPATAAPAPVKLGTTITVSTVPGGRTAYVVRSPRQYPAAPDGSRRKPQKGVFLAVDVEVRAVQGSAYASFTDFALVAKDGTAYEATVAAGFADALDDTDLDEGRKVSGLVVFDVPRSALAGARVELRTGRASAPDGRWQL